MLASPTSDPSPCRVLLASGSPRRHELIRWLNLPVQIAVPRVDEKTRPGEDPAAYVARVARAKALALTAQAADDDIILAADTVVVDRGRILGKPHSPEHAEDMLHTLQGRAHHVLTGFALQWPARGREHVDVVSTTVVMRALTHDEIRAYVASRDPLDKAGAYAVQNQTFRPVAHVEGCFANVVGLPLCAVARVLMRWGCPPIRGLVPRCARAFGYNCAIGIP